MSLRDPAILDHTLDAVQRASLAELVRRARATLGPELERIVLYGSRARGDSEPDSDIDVLVLTRAEPTSEQRTRLSSIAADLQIEAAAYVPFSLAIMSCAAFRELRDRERRFALDVEQEGIAL